MIVLDYVENKLLPYVQMAISDLEQRQYNHTHVAKSHCAVLMFMHAHMEMRMSMRMPVQMPIRMAMCMSM